MHIDTIQIHAKHTYRHTTPSFSCSEKNYDNGPPNFFLNDTSKKILWMKSWNMDPNIARKCLITLFFFVCLFSGREVHILPVWCFHPAGGSADAEHHGGVRLAHLFDRHVQVPRLPGVHQHSKNDCRQQVHFFF